MRALSVLVILCFATLAEAQETVWRMPTEYPASAMPGEGITNFGEAVAKRSGGRLRIEPSFDAALGIKSAGMPEAIRSGKVEAGDAFGGTLAKLDPVFALSSLPFVAPSIPEARRLAEAARPFYERAFAAQGQHLLYTTPWPPSGLWLKEPLASLGGLSLRTYDATSTAVFERAGAKALNISFADAEAKVRDGSVNAVLSSGDGGAGRKLWEHLPHFAEINYAIPLSFATVSQKAYAALDAETRKAVDEAATETEGRQWQAILKRLDANYARMRENGVAIQTTVDPAIAAALRESATGAVEAWSKGAGDAARLLQQ